MLAEARKRDYWSLLAASISDGTIPRLGDLQAAVGRLIKDADMSDRARRLISMGIVFWLGLASLTRELVRRRQER